ncbi:DUF2938 domain-containing protein [Ensifer adhaerens]|uniref:DUF2938 domain-containing protein n=1 Tax=Ensifer adhaerens TaxID=106592 RepID=UPI003D061ADE
MDLYVNWAAASLAIGSIATLVMDLWALLLKRVFSIPSLNYGWVGRWVGGLPGGKLFHSNVVNSPPLAGETAIGWLVHYATGVLFAGALLAIVGTNWVWAPTLWPALLTGWVTLLAPFFILMPGFGFGIAASKVPQPNVARWRSFMAHTAFGLGIYIGAWIISML